MCPHCYHASIVINLLFFYQAFEMNYCRLKVAYHPLYSMNTFVTNKSKTPQDGAHVFPYMG